MAQLAPFDAVDYLDDEQTIAEYLTAALEDPNPDVFLTAVRDVARARGMTQLAKDSGLGRESLYKALSPGANPPPPDARASQVAGQLVGATAAESVV